jgi:hypothetical protein
VCIIAQSKPSTGGALAIFRRLRVTLCEVLAMTGVQVV